MEQDKSAGPSQLLAFDDLVHPELRGGRWMPAVLPWLIPSIIFRHLSNIQWFLTRTPPNITSISIGIATLDGKTQLEGCVARPASPSGLLPGVLWLHGGGMVLGSYRSDLARIYDMARPSQSCLENGSVVIAVDYRLAPAFTAKTLSDDCFAAWTWMLDHATELGIDTTKLVIAGASAGGGLAAALAQRIVDQNQQCATKGPTPVSQILIYPMLDDRTVCHHDNYTVPSISHYPLWGKESNRYGWTSYLGHSPELARNSPYVPARRKDLSGLPNTWIGVGSMDLFHDEDVDYARRLETAGVKVDLEVVNGAFHGFDVVYAQTSLAKAFWTSVYQALRDAVQ